jgi:glyoxylase-like metal-dependent hydrolase (beta-lactamase superfamily II)
MEHVDAASRHCHRIENGPGRRSFDARAYPYAVPVDDGIFLITPAQRQLALENTLLVQDEISVLFDTGLPYAQAAELGEVVDLVVNTHAHLGHTGKNYLFREVWAFEGEADVVEDFEQAVAFHGIRGESVEAEWRAMLELLAIGPVAKVARRFAAGDVLDFGRTRWQVVLTPGHSPGHCSFYEASRGVLYAGDVTLTTFGPWYATPTSDIEAFKQSIRQLMSLDLRVVATSAKGPLREGIKDRFQDFYDRFDQRDQTLLTHLNRPHTLGELVDQLPIYGKPGGFSRHAKIIRFYERIMLEKHLAALLAAGRIICDDGIYRATGE